MTDNDNVKNGIEMFVSFRTLTRAFNDFVTDCVKQYDMSPNEIAVMATLGEESNASQIARRAGVSKALVSRSVKALKNKKLIEVSISPADKREQSLSLTAEGMKAVELIKDANKKFFRDAFRNIDDQPMEIMRLMLAVMMRNLNIGGEYDEDGQDRYGERNLRGY